MECLRLFLDIISLDLDVVVIGETWLESSLVNVFHINGYFGEFSCRSKHIGGGIAVFVSKRHCYKRFDILGDISEDISSVSVSININCNNKKTLLLHSLYRPGDSNSGEFFDIIEKLMHTSSNTDCAIVGDMNLNVNKESNLSTKYLNLLKSYGFYLGNSIPTRDVSESLIDHFIFNNEKYSISHSTVGVDFSDHRAVISSINMEVFKNKYVFKHKTYYNFKNVNADLVSYFEGMSNSDNPDVLYDSFSEYFSNSLNNNSSIKTFKLKNNNLITPYLNFEIIRKFKEKERIRSYLGKIKNKKQLNSVFISKKIEILEKRLNIFMNLQK
jgi:hypothetical protein